MTTPLAQQTSTVTESIIRAKDLQNCNKTIGLLAVLGFFVFPLNPASAFVGLPLLVLCIFHRRQLKNEDK